MNYEQMIDGHVKNAVRRFIKLAKVTRERGIVEGIAVTGRFIIFEIKRHLLWLRLRLGPKNGLILKRIQGSKMYLDASDPGISRELIISGIHETLATKIVRQELEKGMVVLDIGANLGYYALLEASIVGEEGHVHALEPVRRNFDILVKNIDLNCYKNITAYCKGVSSETGTSKIALTDASNWGCMLDMKGASISEYMKQKMHTLTRKMIDVDVVSLDDFLDNIGVNQVDFLRMDIEGYEVQAIKGMLNTLRNTPPPLKMFFEIHNKVFANPEAAIGSLLKQLLAFGFKPKYFILAGKIIHNVGADNFIQIACSHKSVCPHVFLEKSKVL